MKKIYTIVAALLMTASVFAQAPEKMSYQAVVRDASNQLTTNQAVGMQISILQTTATGTAVYVETQTPTTNANGLVSLEIGTGTVVSGDFTTIDWANDTYFIKTETDPTGGTTYTITGTTQLMSVPYALHAKTAESITGTVNYTETDPVYTAWDKSTGIIITESQISDLTHTVDTDTQLDSIDIANLGYVAGATQVTAGTNVTVTGSGTTASPYVVNYTETDPVYTAWDKSTGIIITESQISDLTHTVDTDTQLDSIDIANLGYVAGATQVTAGTNVTVTGSGTTASPYVVNASGHYVGELFGGGIVFYVYNNGANGLIASLDDLDGGSGVAWSGNGNTSTLIGATAQSFYDGAANTTAMVTQDATANKAGTLCDNYTGGSQTDWYLPAGWELNLLYNSAFYINTILENDGDVATNGLNPENVAPTYGRYWSSTENHSNIAWYYLFPNGYSNTSLKSSTYRVRAVRAF